MRVILLLAMLGVGIPAWGSALDDLLMGATALPDQPLSMSELMPAPGLVIAPVAQGQVSLFMHKKTARLQPINSRKFLSDGRELLPNIVINWVQNDAGEVIPKRRHLILTDHLYWDYFVGVGVVWPAQPGKLNRRMSIPLTLVEKNENCVHNGVLVFDTDVSGAQQQLYYQISSETCAYFKADFWGTGTAITGEGILEQPAQVLATYQREKNNRLTTRPLSALRERAPHLKLENLALPRNITPSDMSLYGLVLDDIHYIATCQTRAGAYPFCAQMVLPSYSTAKSLFAGIAMAYLQKRYADLLDQPINQWVKQCQGSQWQGVTFAHLLDMSSGNYDSSAYSADEASADKLAFFTAKSHQDRLAFACDHYSRKSKPGTIFVYHTSDTYLLGAGLNAYIKTKLGQDADLFTDVLNQHIFQPLGLSQITAKTRRTVDNAYQAYTGYGLFFTSDDLVRLSRFVSQQTQAKGTNSILAKTLIRQALQLDPQNPGLSTDYPNLRYQHSFWARKISTGLGCKTPFWLPFMSGFGGITLALLGHGNSYYYLSDSHQYNWSEALPELQKLNLICDSSAPAPMLQTATEK